MELDDIDLTRLDRFTSGFPHEVFTYLRHEAPVWFHPPTAHTPGGEGFWVVSRHADVLLVASDADTFSSAGGGKRQGGGTLIEDLPSGFVAGVMLNMMDAPRHPRFRKLITPSVSPRALARLEAELRERTAAIVDGVAARGACDFLLDVAAELPLQAIARLLGVPQEDRHKLFQWANANLDYDDRELGQAGDKTRAAQAAMFQYGAGLIAKKRACPEDDMLSTVAHGKIQGSSGDLEPLSDMEVAMFFNLLIAAGSETTRNSIAVGLLGLILYPDQWHALRADRSLVPTAIEEILRWSSSTAYNRRTATRDVLLAGHRIRAGEKVTLWWSSANRDEAVFKDSFRFDIRRDPNPHLAFGHNAHFCLGANLARLEIRLILEALLDRFESIELSSPVEWTRSNKHTGVRHMPVKFQLLSGHTARAAARDEPASCTARQAAERYVHAVNAADIRALLALFAPDAVLRHPTGTFAGHEKIQGFYESLVFAGKAQLTTVRLMSEGNAAMMEISATSPFAPPGHKKETVDVFQVDPAGKITELTVFYL